MIRSHKKVLFTTIFVIRNKKGIALCSVLLRTRYKDIASRAGVYFVAHCSSNALLPKRKVLSVCVSRFCSYSDKVFIENYVTDKNAENTRPSAITRTQFDSVLKFRDLLF